jgi:hypothetical protein
VSDSFTAAAREPLPRAAGLPRARPRDGGRCRRWSATSPSSTSGRRSTPVRGPLPRADRAGRVREDVPARTATGCGCCSSTAGPARRRQGARPDHALDEDERGAATTRCRCSTRRTTATCSPASRRASTARRSGSRDARGHRARPRASEHNPDGLPERTVREARVPSSGPSRSRRTSARAPACGRSPTRCCSRGSAATSRRATRRSACRARDRRPRGGGAVGAPLRAQRLERRRRRRGRSTSTRSRRSSRSSASARRRPQAVGRGDPGADRTRAQRARGARRAGRGDPALRADRAARRSSATSAAAACSRSRVPGRVPSGARVPDVQAILIDVDSPAATSSLVPELAAEILAARGQKPIVAVANTFAASAAYWIASRPTRSS